LLFSSHLIKFLLFNVASDYFFFVVVFVLIRVNNTGMSYARAETPLTLTVMHIHQPLAMMTALVDGGAHLDYCNSVGLTPMHKATVSGRREPVKV